MQGRGSFRMRSCMHGRRACQFGEHIHSAVPHAPARMTTMVIGVSKIKPAEKCPKLNLREIDMYTKYFFVQVTVCDT